MKIKDTSIILLYNEKGEVLIQNRKNIQGSHGEDFGFFGGHIEKNENKKEALKRELKEELEINLDYVSELEFFKQHDTVIKEWDEEIKRAVYLGKLEKDLREKFKVHEGKIKIIPIKESFNLKMVPGDSELLMEIYKYLKSNRKIK